MRHFFQQPTGIFLVEGVFLGRSFLGNTSPRGGDLVVIEDNMQGGVFGVRRLFWRQIGLSFFVCTLTDGRRVSSFDAAAVSANSFQNRCKADLYRSGRCLPIKIYKSKYHELQDLMI